MVSDDHIALCVRGDDLITVHKTNHQWTPKMDEYTRMGLFVRSDHKENFLYYVTEKGKAYFEMVEL